MGSYLLQQMFSTTTGSPDLFTLTVEVKTMIRVLVLCRFSLPFCKYFFKIDQHRSLDNIAAAHSSSEGNRSLSKQQGVWHCCLDVGKALTEIAKGPQESLSLSFN